MNQQELRLKLGQRLGIGFDGYEIPEDCARLIREYKIGNVILFRRNVKSKEQLKKLCGDLHRLIKEETGLTLTSWQYRGIVNFQSEDWKERMYLFTADAYEGSLSANCDEGDLCWVESGRIKDLSLWEGDRVFLSLLEQDEPLFLLDLHYSGENLIRAVLNGHELTLSRASVPV